MPTKKVASTPKSVPAEKNILDHTPRATQDYRKAYMLALVGFLLVMAYYFKHYVVAAMVNNKPISRLSVVKELEKQGGKQALDSLVTQELIKQEAKKKGITVNDQDVEKKMAELDTQFKAQGQSLDQVLETQGTTKDAIKGQLKVQVMLEKLLGDKIKVTEKEIDEAYEQQKELFAEEKDMKKVRTTIQETLKSQKLSASAQELIDEIKKTAKVRYFITY